ncbi:hypothetical protein EDB85DRAFT_1900400 [Lactarius pseudohatsudake]|nr:hypothetical protein EDB85DRAFT_1900400 [Lactarius pseudohatsudake]
MAESEKTGVKARKSDKGCTPAPYRAAIAAQPKRAPAARLNTNKRRTGPTNWGQLEYQWGGDDTPPTSLTSIIATYNSSVTFKASDSDTRSKRKRAQLHPTRLRTRTTARRSYDRARRARAATGRAALELRLRAQRHSRDRARKLRLRAQRHSRDRARRVTTATARTALELRLRAPRHNYDRARHDLVRASHLRPRARAPTHRHQTIPDRIATATYEARTACGTGRRRPKGNHIPPNGWTAATYAISMARRAHRRARTIPTKTQRRILVQDYAHTSRGPCFT